MKGEFAHRKGKIMSGKYPVRTAKKFIIMLKGLIGNANMHEINEPIIVEAYANQASRPMGRFGRVERKRTHITIVAKEKKN
jgi:ribosomal protein L22